MANNIIANVTYVPTMAATALYHGKIKPQPESQEAFLQAARAFATDELLPALFKGNQLDAATRRKVGERMAYFTGLSQQFIGRAKLRVNGWSFARELLRDQGLAPGLLDARCTRDDIDDLAVQPESDAANEAISAAFQAALREYISHDLKVDWSRQYKAPADVELDNSWRWRPVPDGEPWEPWSVNIAGHLANTLRTNPGLKVFVASGDYDLIRPFFDAQYTLNRHDIPMGRVEYDYYPAGHMMYINDPSREQLLQDVRNFIRKQLDGDRHRPTHGALWRAPRASSDAVAIFRGTTIYALGAQPYRCNGGAYRPLAT